MQGVADGSNQTVLNTWAGFRKALVDRFQPANVERVARDRLIDLRQDGTVVKYASIFQQLLLKCPDIGVTDQKHRFIRGLKPKIRETMLLVDPVDLNACISMAERVDSVHLSVRSTYGSSSTPMELGAVTSGEVETAVETNPEGRDDLVERLAALRYQPKQSGLHRADSRKSWVQRVQQGAAGQKGYGSRVLLTEKERADRRNECMTKHLCHKCMRPGHHAQDCNATWRPKGDALPV